MNSGLFIPKNYRTILTTVETEKAILALKDFFQQNLAFELDLIRVTAPLFVKAGTGINDDLNGVEQPVSFTVKEMANTQVEIVQSLAKWKRMMLTDLGIQPGKGLYT
ncbi:MAG TPA: aspartate--ammonia ligase, partial [Candidatus Marinimicrobia bacterium]|nr:aspartate--ammonia ligase [Candidatus Neomarinimicrobiota bacterium]